MDKTDWFQRRRTKPVHVGVYEVQCNGLRVMFSYWDGRSFNWLSTSSEGAFKGRHRCGAGSCVIRWRGLTQNPEASHE